MSSDSKHRFFIPLHLKLVLLTSLTIAAGFVILAGFTYFLLQNSLQSEAEDELRFKLLENWAAYQTGGIEFLESGQMFEGGTPWSKPFFLRISDSDDSILYSAVPEEWKEYQLETVPPDRLNTGAAYIPSETAQFDLLTMSVEFDDGKIIQVGMSTEEYRTTLSRFIRVLAFTLLPLLITAVLAGLFITGRVLQPIKELIFTVQSISTTGKMDIRVPTTESGDELNTLGKLFNGMLDKIELLVANMRDTLDNVAHDLRTPVTRLRLSAESLLRSNEEGNDTTRGLNEVVIQSAELQEMLNTLLNIREAESGAVPLKKETLLLNQLIEDLIELYTYVAETKSIRITYHLPRDVWVSIDKNRFRQVISNLLDNAIKYTPEGGSISVSLEDRMDRVDIKVTDNGVGIESSEIDTIWNRLYRSRKTAEQPGFGLGLTLVKAIVEAHSGTVRVESAPGRGSTFTVRLYRSTPISNS